MKVIGHRGAAGLALENSLEAIRTAIVVGVDAIEFDIRLTSDGEFVLCHDQSVSRVSDQTHVIKEVVATKHIEEIVLHNGEKLPTLKQALDTAGKTPVIIETKGTGWAYPLAQFLDSYRPIDATVISFNHNELGHFAKASPAIPTFAI